MPRHRSAGQAPGLAPVAAVLASVVASVATTITASLTAQASLAAPRCTFLQPLGSTSTSPIVSKTVGHAKVSPFGMAFGRTNWNTDFVVAQPYDSYKFFFTANSSDSGARYPVKGYIKFSDGSSLEVINELMQPPIGTGRMFGPFLAVPGKQASQLNFKVGATSDPGAMGFSYRISVQGCTGS